MSAAWQAWVVGACVVASAAHLSLLAWPTWPGRARRVLVLRLLAAPARDWRHRLARRIAPPARIAFKPGVASACGGCSGCSRDDRDD